MPTEADLLAAIDARPDDDAPRLAHADWLEANGDPDRAGFIRLQVQRPDDDTDEGLKACALLDVHGERWLAGRPQCPGLRWEFERGYPEVVEYRTLKAFRATWQAVFAHPVRRVEFVCLNGRADTLAAEPGLRHIRSLVLRFCYRGKGLLDLLGSANLAQLERLSIRGDGLTAEFVKGLAGLESLPGLAALELRPLRRIELPADVLEALAFSANLRQLRELRLEYRLGATATVLWRPGALPALEELELDAKLGPDALVGLEDQRALPCLRSLNLNHNQLGDEGAEFLARAGRAGLRELALGYNVIGDHGVVAMAGSADLAGLERLGLRYNQVSDAGAVALAGSPHLRSLKALSLANNMVGEAGVRALGRSRLLPALARLDLEHNPASPALIQAVTARFRDGKPPLVDEVVPAVPRAVPDAPTVGDADEDGLVRAIWADPYDEVARLVYADWLEEHGRPLHAALLRASPEEQAALFASIESSARADAPAGLVALELEDGLVRARIAIRSLRSKAFERDGPDWLRRHCIAEVAPEGSPRDWAALFAAPWLEHVRGLNFARRGLGGEQIQALAASPHLARLASLDLRDANLYWEEKALALAGALGAPCRLLMGRVPGGFVQALADSRAAPALRHLALRSLPLEAGATLASSPSFSGLVTLSLESCSLRDAGIKALADSTSLTSLRNLDLSRNWFTGAGVEFLEASPLLPRLRRLRLCEMRLDAADLARLARAVAATPHCRLVVDKATSKLRKVLGDRLIVE